MGGVLFFFSLSGCDPVFRIGIGGGEILGWFFFLCGLVFFIFCSLLCSSLHEVGNPAKVFFFFLFFPHHVF